MRWWEKTRGRWSAIPPADAYMFLRLSRRKKNEVVYRGETFRCVHVSISHSPLGRGYSVYFESERYVVRISDHWSSTGDAFPRSHKLNCGHIRSCYWALECTPDHAIEWDGGSRYPYRMVGGIIEKSSFELEIFEYCHF